MPKKNSPCYAHVYAGYLEESPDVSALEYMSIVCLKEGSWIKNVQEHRNTVYRGIEKKESLNATFFRVHLLLMYL